MPLGDRPEKRIDSHLVLQETLTNWKMGRLEDHWSCSSPERLSHCKLKRFRLIENRPMKVYAWTLLKPGHGQI